MKKIYLFNILIIAITAVIFSSCEKNDPIIPNEEELITTLKFTLVPAGGGTPVVFSFRDLDGDGGNDPEVSVGILHANTSYTGSFELLNEQDNPPVNITREIEAEGKEHQFFFRVSEGLNLSVKYNDKDDGNDPIGLETLVSAGATSSGLFTITLRHEPDKSASGVADGDITNAGGETDIEVQFDVSVQ